MYSCLSFSASPRTSPNPCPSCDSFTYLQFCVQVWMQRTQCSVMQDRTDAWTLATQSWWTLSTHAVAFSASKSLTPTSTFILTKGLGRNQNATDPISPVGLFGLTYSTLALVQVPTMAQNVNGELLTIHTGSGG
jgi:hypothetical protein